MMTVADLLMTSVIKLTDAKSKTRRCFSKHSDVKVVVNC